MSGRKVRERQTDRNRKRERMTGREFSDENISDTSDITMESASVKLIRI